MSDFPFDLELLWEATDNGLIFFQDEFSSFMSRKKGLKGFSLRDDDATGSCYVSKSKKTKLWLFTDFGANNITPDQKGINAIDYVMKRDNCDFSMACKTLFSQYGLAVSEFQKVEPKTEFSAKVTKEKDYWNVSYYPEIQSEKHLKSIFPFYTNALLRDYNFRQIKTYENVGVKKDGATLYQRKITATNDFPIYGYEEESFVKLYQPKAPKGDKYILKHSFVGEKPERYIFGWDRIFDKVDYNVIESLHKELKEEKDKKQREYLKEKLQELQLDCIVIATGGTDGINIASLGYDVIWFNSETEVIATEEYLKLSKIAKVIYYVADLDETGVKQAVKMGLEFITIKILWLPDWLLQDRKKDFKDWICKFRNEKIEKVTAIFKKMLSQALNFQFWDYPSVGRVSLNPKKLLHFLKHKNIRLYKMPYKTSDTGKEDEGYFIKLEKNLISKVYSSDIKRTCLEWLDDNYHSINIYNMVLKSPFFNQNSLKALPFFEYKRNNCGQDFQYYFFNNKAVKVTADEIATKDFSTRLPVTLWEDDRVDHYFEKRNPYFEITTDKLQRKRIKVLDKSSNYFKVLINTSRIFWQKDCDETGLDKNNFTINSKALTDDENYLQEVHLLNKMYCVGYLLHQYKMASKSWMVLGVDFASGTSVKGSYGGTGKSFLQKSLFRSLNSLSIGGKTLEKDNFPMDGVTPKTRFVLFDDLAAYQPMEFFYNLITDNFVANQKGGVKYNIPFDDSAKIGATTNFAPDMTPSTKRRLLVYYNSDYYHEATDDNGYPFSRKISDDFNGKDILTKEYSTEEWNSEFNFQLQCLQFYLSQTEKVEAPIDTLVSKSKMMKIGDSYIKFFNELFSEPTSLNDWVERTPVVAMAKEDLGNKFISAQRFTDNLKLYCEANKDNGWSLEMKKKKNTAGNSVIHFFVSTDGKKVEHTTEEENTNTEDTPKQENEKLEPETDLLF
ncbi:MULTISPECIES: primase-helicase family protein [Flavobacterium]|uniref:Primase-helicase family protein n=1 Tax=Flavobacterium jumunjinense TaxID=998845 RepID=A0ABV5GQ16_9FLAO|nr:MULTISPECIES: primase-helicase family protein [Flavobacterium]